MSATPETIDGPLLTADGVPLKASLQKSLRRAKLRAALLVAPPLLFLIFLFIIPIGSMLTRSVDDTQINKVLPRTFEAFDAWDKKSDPPEALYEAMYLDLKNAEKIEIGQASTRMNYAEPGWRSLVKVTARRIKKIEPPYKEAFIKIDDRWAELTYWRSLGIMKDPITFGYYLNAVDLDYDFDKNIIQQDENRRVYNLLWWRTILVSVIVTLACLILAYPVSYLLATLPMRYSNLLMICVLMPFWTSLLVRTTSWIVLLQKEGVINDILVWLGLIGEDGRLQMIYNMTGTVIAMVHILLPFMVLPLFSVMKTISPSYMRAAKSLGATPARAFWKVYFPQSVPGIGAGSILVFILAVGYYITPALVGGRTGQLISNFIAFHMQKSLNWGLAAALGGILLASILVLYWLYNRLIGIDNMKLG